MGVEKNKRRDNQIPVGTMQSGDFTLKLLLRRTPDFIYPNTRQSQRVEITIGKEGDSAVRGTDYDIYRGRNDEPKHKFSFWIRRSWGKAVGLFPATSQGSGGKSFTISVKYTLKNGDHYVEEIPFEIVDKVAGKGFSTLSDDVSTLGIVEEEEIPGSFNLGQNYPNPFNPSTTIEYSITKSSHVRLHVYDITGRHVETLVDNTVEAGTYRQNFDASSLSSGTYFYKIVTQDAVDIRQMQLIK